MSDSEEEKQYYCIYYSGGSFCNEIEILDVGTSEDHAIGQAEAFCGESYDYCKSLGQAVDIDNVELYEVLSSLNSDTIRKEFLKFINNSHSIDFDLTWDWNKDNEEYEHREKMKNEKCGLESEVKQLRTENKQLKEENKQLKLQLEKQTLSNVLDKKIPLGTKSDINEILNSVGYTE